MAFIITLTQSKIDTKQEALGWDIEELIGCSKLNEKECEALLIKKDAVDNARWEFRPFGKDFPMSFKELTIIIKGIHKLAHLLGYNYYELIKVRSI